MNREQEIKFLEEAFLSGSKFIKDVTANHNDFFEKQELEAIRLNPKSKSSIKKKSMLFNKQCLNALFNGIKAEMNKIIEDLPQKEETDNLVVKKL